LGLTATAKSMTRAWKLQLLEWSPARRWIGKSRECS